MGIERLSQSNIFTRPILAESFELKLLGWFQKTQTTLIYEGWSFLVILHNKVTEQRVTTGEAKGTKMAIITKASKKINPESVSSAHQTTTSVFLSLIHTNHSKPIFIFSSKNISMKIIFYFLQRFVNWIQCLFTISISIIYDYQSLSEKKLIFFICVQTHKLTVLELGVCKRGPTFISFLPLFTVVQLNKRTF